MASVISDPNGRKRIQWVIDGRRKLVRIGKATAKQAERVRLHVEQLIAASILGHPPDDETTRWLAGIDDTLHARLADKGLAKPRGGNTAALGGFIDRYITGRESDAKERTLINLKAARKDLIDYFGKDKPLKDVSEGDADEFYRHLLGRGLSANTARRLCGRAKQFFRAAVRKRIVQGNPFADVKCHVQANPDREHFIARDVAQKVIDACPDAEWKLIFALSRFGGLRCPSEHLALTWGDVDWEHCRLRVPSCKTEHHEGREFRYVPIFPELYPHLREVYEQAPEGSRYVIARYRDKNANLRTRLQRIIDKAGVEPWPKLFHNLRATRQTELAETFPIHVVCAWLGNTEAVAKKHYLQVTDEHFRQAAGEGGVKSVQNAAQHTPVPGRTEPQTAGANLTDSLELQACAAGCGPVQDGTLPPRGRELSHDSPEKTPLYPAKCAESGARPALPGRYTLSRGRVRQRVPRAVRTVRSEQTRQRVVELLSR